MEDPVIELPALRMFRLMYRTFEEDVLACFRHIEPTKENVELREDMSEVYSIELYRLHIDFCSAIDSLLHLWYVKKKGPKETDARDYYPLFSEPDIDIKVNNELKLQRNPEISIKPLSDWTEKKRPSWWTDHNITKHNLDQFTFPKGNLGNMIYSLGAFYLLLNDKGTRQSYPVGTQVFIALF